jgi:aminoglycoside phosphotransferase (APT) family kinase protein
MARWAYDVLASVGAPVPRVLAASEEAHREAVLLEFVEGEPLGTLAPDLRPAWHVAGRALARVQTVKGRAASRAGCEQVGIRAPTASRGPYHYGQALANLAQLAGARSDLRPVLSLGPLIESARPLFDSAPLALCQYDTHLWQFLLVEERGRWRCSAILDWEHADLDDPDWHLAQLDVFRFAAPTGPVPPAFFDGYGYRPRSPLYELYRLERVAWLLHAHTRGVGWVGLSVPLAEAWLHELLAEPTRLQDAGENALASLS